ncbi:hypothetical protein V8E36_002953, partial [Tilletia maclaganii]
CITIPLPSSTAIRPIVYIRNRPDSPRCWPCSTCACRGRPRGLLFIAAQTQPAQPRCAVSHPPPGVVIPASHSSAPLRPGAPGPSRGAASLPQVNTLARGPGFQPRPDLRALASGGASNPGPSGSIRAPYPSAARPTTPPHAYSPPASEPSSPAPSSLGFTIVEQRVGSNGGPGPAPPSASPFRADPPVADAPPSTPHGSAASPLHPSQLTPSNWEPMDIDDVADIPRAESPEWDEEDDPAPADVLAPASAPGDDADLAEGQDAFDEDLDDEEDAFDEEGYLGWHVEHEQVEDLIDDADLLYDCSIYGSDEAEEHDSPPVDHGSPASSHEDGDDVDEEPDAVSQDGSLHGSDIEFERADEEDVSSDEASEEEEEDGDLFLTQNSNVSDSNDARRDHLRAWNRPGGEWRPRRNSPSPSTPSSPLTTISSADGSVSSATHHANPSSSSSPGLAQASTSATGAASASGPAARNSVPANSQSGPEEEKPLRVVCMWVQDERANTPPEQRITHGAPQGRQHGLVFRRLSDGEIQARHVYGWLYAHTLRLARPAEPPACEGCINEPL